MQSEMQATPDGGRCWKTFSSGKKGTTEVEAGLYALAAALLPKRMQEQQALTA